MYWWTREQQLFVCLRMRFPTGGFANASLGLELLKQVEVETVNGISTARVFQDAKISLLGREGTFECLEIPSGRSPLLGVIPLEALGVELDLQNQKLKLLPISPTETYLTIL